jgi:hypothetical protein
LSEHRCSSKVSNSCYTYITRGVNIEYVDVHKKNFSEVSNTQRFVMSVSLALLKMLH